MGNNCYNAENIRYPYKLMFKYFDNKIISKIDIIIIAHNLRLMLTLRKQFKKH